jgi:hypothetical protein
MDEIHNKLAPVQAEVRRCLSNFILGEDHLALKGSCSAHRSSWSIHLAIAAAEGVESRRSRIYGGARLGAVEADRDWARRFL